MPTGYIILGTPRSGTSLLAGLLHHMGIFMGEAFLEPNPMNPRGFYQDVDFERIFDSLPTFMPRPPYKLTTIKEQELIDLVKRRCDLGVDWGVKCNRISYALDTVIATSTIPIKFLQTHRTPFATVCSLASWEEYSIAEEVIRHSIMSIYESLKELEHERMVVDFNQIIKEPTTLVRRIAKFVGRDYRDEFVSLVDPSLKHFG